MFAVAGVSGQTGSVVAETLLSQGHPVTVIVRSVSKGEPWRKRGAQVAVAELDNVKAMTEILSQATGGAYLLVPPNPATNDFLADRRLVSDALVAAIEASDIPHVVALSSIGAQLAEGTGPILSSHYNESVLRKAKAPSIVLLRAAYFIDNFASSLPPAKEHGVLPTFLTLDHRMPMVSTLDIGRAAAELLLAGPVEGVKTVELNGPADISPNDVAAQLAAILGKPVAVQQGPIEAMVGALMGFGFTPDQAGLLRDMTAAANNGSLVYETAIQRHGTTTLEESLRRILS